jgi:hypothetical protein
MAGFAFYHRGQGYMRTVMEIQVIERPTRREREPDSRAVVPQSYLSTAEVAECTCPEACERDHDRD